MPDPRTPGGAPARPRSPALGADQETLDARIPTLLDKWSRGEASLKDLYGFTEDELFGVSSQAYTLLMEGKLEQAKAIFEGLVALDPRNDYYYRALGVIYHRLGDSERAVRQFGYALKVNPHDLISYVNRAEINVQQKNYPAAEQDLRTVLELGARMPGHAMVRKATAILTMLPKSRQRLGR